MNGTEPLWSSRLAWRFFDVLFRPWMARRVNVHLTGWSGAPEPGFPVVLVANHESWWDGFLLREVQRALRPAARFHAVMLDRELSPRPFLRLLGGLGVTPGSTASHRRLLRTMRLLRRQDPTGTVAYFPQGAIRPGSAHGLGFRKGVLRVAEALAPSTVVPVGIRVRGGTTPRMDAFISVGAPLAVPGRGALSLALLEASVEEELDAIDGFVAAHGEDAARRYPSFDGPLPRGPHQQRPLPHVGGWISRN